MFKWAQSALANVAGTQEPIYGPEAITSVAKEAESTPFTELKRDDLKWEAMTSTSVESQIFYLQADSGLFGFVQVIHSNVAGIHTTSQFNTKIFYKDGSPPLWCTSPLYNSDFSQDKTAFYATDCAVELSEDGNEYTVKSMTDERAIVNLTIKRVAPGFVAGKTGKTIYGTDPQNPWGSIRHAFWPRCSLAGSITTKDGPVDFKGRAMFVHALQGMKPHHAAAKWDFVDFHSPTYSAVMMQFTTPPSYGSTVVNVGGIVKDGEIIMAGSSSKIEHTKVKASSSDEWAEPISARFTWNGKTADGRAVEAVLEGELGERLDRIDLMAEVPGIVKKFVGAAVGTKPYIYQYNPQKPKLSLKLKIGDQEIVEEGELFTEATFISET